MLTSNHLRHEFVAGYVGRHLNLIGIWQEEKSFAPLSYAGSGDDRRIIEEHFAKRDSSERAYFGRDPEVGLEDGRVLRRLPAGAINHPEEVRTMVDMQPQVVLVFGTSLLSKAITSAFPNKVLNIHLGLSPYYRGAGTNFWPLVNEEPEMVGATVHFLDEGIDTGRIITHVRPLVEASDGPHDLGNKTIIAAAEALVRAANALAAGAIRGHRQEGGGRLYQRRDFNAQAVVRLYRNFDEGMLPRYLADQAARDARLRLVGMENLS